MPKISVIIPVYNTEKYLHRCIDSILAQTFTDYELLLINDGSKDNSGTICDEYAKKDSRIRVVHKENGGVSSARNMGLDNAKGEWICFIDSDDWVEKEYLKVLYQDGKYDYVTCYWKVLNCKTYQSNIPTSKAHIGVANIKQFIEENIHRLSFPVCRLYKKNIIEKHTIRFDKRISFCEDALFNILYLGNIKSVRQTNDVLYNYEKHEASLSNTSKPWEELDYAICKIGDGICELEEKLSCNGESLLQHYIWSVLLRKYLTFLQYQKSIKECRAGLKQVYKNRYVQKIFKSSLNKQKSRFRKLFDFLMRQKLFYCATILLKVQCLLFKAGIVKPR